MCTGVEPWVIAAISAASTAAGTVSQINANKKREGAAKDAALRDLQRKQATSDKANAVFEAETQNSDAGDASAAADKAAEEQLAQTKALIERAPAETGFTSAAEPTGMADASPVVKEVAARTLADELSRTEGQLKSAATLQGLAQRQRDRATQFGRAGEQMALLGNFNQGWNNVADYEQRMAQFAGSKQAMLGDALVGMGSIGSAYAGAQGFGAKGNNYSASAYKPTSTNVSSPYYENQLENFWSR